MRSMAGAQQARVQKEVEDMVHSLEQDHIRKMQVSFMFHVPPKTEYRSNTSRYDPVLDICHGQH